MQGIIFSTESVRAILEGRKTMTRRLVRLPIGQRIENMKPRYQPGNILYVKEAWAEVSDFVDVDPAVGIPDGYIYKADWEEGAEAPEWNSPLFMPEKAARLFIMITAVRAERLQEISENGCYAEGIKVHIPVPGDGEPNPRLQYANLWDKLNPKYPWRNNPWVWAYTFVVEPNPWTTIQQRLAGAGHQIGLTEAQIIGLSGALASVGVQAQMGGTSLQVFPGRPGPPYRQEVRR